jgi:hypothetical protein
MRLWNALEVFAFVSVSLSAGLVTAAEQSGLGGYKATATADGRLKYTMETSDFTFSRVTASDTRETEITISGPNEAPLTIRLGGPDGLSVERSGQIVAVRHGDDNAEAIAALMVGRAVSAFRRHVGTYERQLMNDTAALSDPVSPFAYSLLLTAAFVGELAGDPNAVARTRDLIRRRLAAKVRAAAWQQRDCVTDYELALMANDTRQTQCMESADGLDSFWARAAERLLCGAEFLAGAISAEAQFVQCSALKIQ